MISTAAKSAATASNSVPRRCSPRAPRSTRRVTIRRSSARAALLARPARGFARTPLFPYIRTEEGDHGKTIHAGQPGDG